MSTLNQPLNLKNPHSANYGRGMLVPGQPALDRGLDEMMRWLLILALGRAAL